ncbi:SDR family NAD(P)-dependent oxidoreductase [Ammoniphilus sp. 3BR4]|uniref:SDR family NAD(P)-dependent oxidoreductase n=1 Tax=Ammoniphilus sp. 3BR4 TaxID=3158265 RepID=UPI003466CD80
MKKRISGPIQLQGQTAIVTGGARGIGACVARALAREGADVVVSDVLPFESVVSDVEKYGRRSLGIQCDITNPDQVNALVQATVNHFGKIDILVACAGIVRRTNFLELSVEDWNRVMDVNLTGMFLTVQSVYRQMAYQESGKIVCIGSIAGKVGGVIAGTDYVASKGGVHSFVKSVAKEAAPKGVYVNGIAPGPVNSHMTDGIPYRPETVPLQRMGEPEDIAEAAIFLASQASNYITGQILNVNGGILME